MDKKVFMEKLAREAYEKGSFNGVWLCAEHGEIVSKGDHEGREGCLMFDDFTCKKL